MSIGCPCGSELAPDTAGMCDRCRKAIMERMQNSPIVPYTPQFIMPWSSIEVAKVFNGYILKAGIQFEIYKTQQELFERLEKLL